MKNCSICGRALDQENDPLSIDCRGDCWGCIGEIEAEMGDAASRQKAHAELDAGSRPAAERGLMGTPIAAEISVGISLLPATSRSRKEPLPEGECGGVLGASEEEYLSVGSQGSGVSSGRASEESPMGLPRVYADFNAIEYPLGVSFAEMPLTGYGTLASLASQQLRLSEGMALVLFEPNDIECRVTVHFDPLRPDPAGRQGEWIARFESGAVQDNTQSADVVPRVHPCIACGELFGLDLIRNYAEACSACGASVMEPMLPPQDAT